MEAKAKLRRAQAKTDFTKVLAENVMSPTVRGLIHELLRKYLDKLYEP